MVSHIGSTGTISKFASSKMLLLLVTQYSTHKEVQKCRKSLKPAGTQ